jgi:acylphosphatase
MAGTSTRGVEGVVLYVAVRGRVQGVGFRWYVRERAHALGLTGWVRNRDDGSVEVLATGQESALQQFRGHLRSGPPGAKVIQVEDQDGEPLLAAMNPFGILK